MSYQPPQDPNNPSQYGGYGGYTPPQTNPTDPYSGQPGQPGGYQQPGSQQPGGYQQPGYQQPGYQQPGYQQPPYGQGQQQYNYQAGATASGPTSMGMQPNVAAALSYLTFVAGLIIFFLLEKQNRFVRFNAMQSILFFLPLTILLFIFGYIPLIGGILYWLVWLVGFVGWIVLTINAFQGKYFKLPYIGDYAEKYANQGTM
ncbi:MAG TPA: DUF4870 domain-containing protein [Ktedonobacteraceae bacterium]|nr:DUF4870 domain-containing protein [Ktedonobacteraceae bacterium]